MMKFSVIQTTKKLLRNVRGAILIEFAICMPILLLLLFGLHDIFRMARYQDQTNFVAHEIVQMIQNVSQARKDKKITKADIANIIRFASYTIYPGKTMYAMSNYDHVYAHIPYVSVIYVRGESDGKASAIWKCYYRPLKYVHNTDIASLASTWKNDNELVRRKESKAASEIYPTLTIADGEVKIIVEAYIYKPSDNPDGACPVKKAFGTYLLTPPARGESGYFNSVAIFTPKRGLFDETGPQ